VESLIKFGIDLNFKDRSDQGVSYWVIVIFCFLTYNLLYYYQLGRTSLIFSVIHNYIDIIELLIEAGACLNIKDNVCIYWTTGILKCKY
jgi:hypothetical protein